MLPLIIILLCWLGSVLPVQAQGVTLLSEGFEGSAAQVGARWPERGVGMEAWPNNHAYELNTNPAYVRSGTQSLLLKYNEGPYSGNTNPGGSVFRQLTNQAYNEIWVTYDTLMVSPFYTGGNEAQNIGGVGTKGIYMYMYSPAFNRYFGWVPNWLYGGKQHQLGTQGCRDNWNGIPYDSSFFSQNVQPTEQPDNIWTRHEVHYKLNTPGQADGLLEEYQTIGSGPRTLVTRYTGRRCLDDNTNGAWPNAMPSDARWNKASIYRQFGSGRMYVDNFTVTTEAIGSGGAPPPGPLPDTSPPNAPTNLNVTELWERLKTIVATVWQWLGPASAEAATAASDQAVIRWDPRPGQRFMIDLTGFAWSGAKTFADLDAGIGVLTVPLPGLPPGQPGDDRWLCAQERDGKAMTGCNQLALGPIVLPPPPDPEPVPEIIGPAIVTMSGDKVFIACDPARYTKASTTGRGTKRTITCLP